MSLDISSKKTGWSFSIKDRVCGMGVIEISTKLDVAERLVVFRKDLKDLFHLYKPSHIVIENGWGGRNIKTLKVLSAFSGVAQELCLNVLNIKPYIMNNKTTKAHFKVKTKEDLFYKIIEVYGWGYKNLEFKEDNDKTDAVAQSICFFETKLGGHNRKKERCIYKYEEDIFNGSS
jgi:Holliday junction resolvasome RuvABC endonuclease subunit